MSAWTTQRPWLILIASLFLVGEAILVVQSGWVALLGDLSLAVLLVASVLSLTRTAQLRLTSSLQDLEEAMLRMASGDLQAPVPPPASPEMARLTGALEHARKRLARNFDDVVRAKTALSDQLARAREQLQDPVVDRRKANLEKLRLSAYVIVAGIEGTADLVDFWLDHVELALERGLAKELPPGQPVTIRIVSSDGVKFEGTALAHGPTRGRHGARLDWSFVWSQPVPPADLWPPLWHAVNPRVERRVCPPADQQLRAVLHVDETNFAATVLDMSKGGVGIVVSESMETLGLVGHGALASLTVELPGDRTVKERVWVRSVDVREDGTRLGLALEGLNPENNAMLATYLVEMQQREELPDAPLQFV